MAERGVVWSEAETKLLLSIWMEESIQNNFLGQKETKEFWHYFCIIFRSGLQCRVKINRWKQSTKKVVDNNKWPGRAKTSFKYFSELDQILRDNPVCHPEYTFDSSIAETGFSEEVSSSDNEGKLPHKCETFLNGKKCCHYSVMYSPREVLDLKYFYFFVNYKKIWFLKKLNYILAV